VQRRARTGPLEAARLNGHLRSRRAVARAQVQQSYEFVTNLAFGVTTMHNPSFDTLSGFADAELVRAGTATAPAQRSGAEGVGSTLGEVAWHGRRARQVASWARGST